VEQKVKKKQKKIKRKVCKIGGIWIDAKRYPLLGEMEAEESINDENESERRLTDGKRKPGEKSGSRK
jgi:hypothetical protein